jgi:sec-independent protein translocase protein TatC
MKTVRDGSFWDHLEELRQRLFYMIGGIVVCTGAAFAFSRRLMDLVLEAGPGTLQTLSPYEAITANLKLALVAGLVASSPLTLWHFWRFVSPGLYRSEKRVMASAFWISILLFTAGVAFSWFVLLKPTLALFASFETGSVTGGWTLSNFVSFLGQFTLVFGLSFELPLVVLVLVKLGVVEPADLARFRRHVIVGLLVLGAILPPNDPVTQLLLAAPLYVLYEISIIAARMIRRSERKSGDRVRPGRP